MVLTAAPTLVTERLDLRPPVAADRAALLDIVSHPQTARFLGAAMPDPADHFQRFARNAGSWFLYGYGAFTVRLRDSDTIIGNCGVFHSWRGLGSDFDDHPEAGWIVGHDHQGRGLAHEAMSAALRWFSDTHGERPIVCMISPGNAPSLRLAQRLGFADLRTARLPDGDPIRLFVRSGPHT